MNTKRVTAMRHRRPTRRTEKEKERDCVVEAAALAAAKATVEAIMHQEEDDEYPGFSAGYSAACSIEDCEWERNLESYFLPEPEPPRLTLPEHIRQEMMRTLREVSIVPRVRAGYVKIMPSTDEERMHLLYKDVFAKKRKAPNLPVMTKSELSALSDRMYAVTLEEMQEELYDDAE